ncbi:MAG: META domain-containing protein [Limisphaerales bacterium]
MIRTCWWIGLALVICAPPLTAKDLNPARAEIAPKVADAPLGDVLAALAGTRWRLVEMAGESVGTNRPPTLVFAAEGKISGHAGVNRFSGSLRVEGETLKVGPLAATRMAGSPAAMEREAKYLGALESISRLERDGDTLRLRGPGDAPPLVFMRESEL